MGVSDCIDDMRRLAHYYTVAMVTLLLWLLSCYRGMMDENNEQFVAYFLPVPATIAKRKEDDESGILFKPEEE